MHRRPFLSILPVVLLACCCIAAAPTPADWPQFRGPTGEGISPAKGVPTTWSADKNVKWKVALPGAGSSSPVIVGDRVFITAYTGYAVPGEPLGNLSDLVRHVICLKLSDGSIIWKKELPAVQPESERVRDHGYAASTPICDGERLYVFLGKSGVFAFDLDGKQLWNTSVGTSFDGWGSAASPVLYKETILINACIESSAMVALDRKTGKEVWRTRNVNESWQAPKIVPLPGGKTDLVLAMSGKLVGYDPDTGKERWTCKTDIGWYMVPGLLARDGIIYVTGGRTGAFLAIKAGGSGDVTSSHILWKGRKGSNVTSPLYHDGHLYWANDQAETAFCAKADTGEVVYESRLPRGGQVYASPVLIDGKIYYQTRNGGVFVVAAKPSFEIIAHNQLGDRSTFDASPAVAGKMLMLRSHKFLYCIGE